LLEREFSNAKELTERVLDDLKLKAKVGKSLSGLSARPRKKYVDNKAQLDIKRFGEIIMNERLAAKGKAR